MFWRVSIRHISGVWNVQSSCWSFYNFTTFWGPTRLFPTKKMHRESSSGIPPKTENGLSQLWMANLINIHNILFPYFMWCFYIMSIWRWMNLKISSDYLPWFHVPSNSEPSVDLTVGSGELSTEKLWSQVSEANLMGFGCSEKMWEFSIGCSGIIYHLESRWRNSHVLVFHGPLLVHLLGVEPSTFTTV